MYQMNRTNLNRNEVYHGRTSQGLLWLGWSKVRVLWTLYKRAFSRLHNTLTVFCTENLLEFRTTQVSLHFEALATKLSMLDGDQKRAFYAIVSNEKWIERILQSRMLHFYLSLMEYFFFITCFHFACHVAELHLVYRTTDVVLMLCILLLLLLHHRLFQPRTRMALLKHLKLYVLWQHPLQLLKTLKGTLLTTFRS